MVAFLPFKIYQSKTKVFILLVTSIVKIVLMISLYVDEQSLSDSFMAIEEMHSIIVIILLGLWLLSIITELFFSVQPLYFFCVGIFTNKKKIKNQSSIIKNVKDKGHINKKKKMKVSNNKIKKEG